MKMSHYDCSAGIFFFFFPQWEFLHWQVQLHPNYAKKDTRVDVSWHLRILQLCESTSSVLCCHLQRLFIQLYLLWMQTYVGPGGKRSYNSGCDIRLCWRTASSWHLKTFITKIYWMTMSTYSMKCAGMALSEAEGVSGIRSKAHHVSSCCLE